MQTNKKIIYFSATISTAIYAVWRIFFTLPLDQGGLDNTFAILLLSAELVGFFEAANYLWSMTSKYHLEKPEIPEEMYPHVDVFIATYNEGEALLKKTVNGCKNMEYPDKSKVHIYLCDDTARPEIENLAKKMGIGYFKRKDNIGAKAGNLNNAFRQTKSPLIATFDADMIPMHDFLTALVPYFFVDKFEKDADGRWVELEEEKSDMKMGFVQSPQSFYNSDLFQYNLFSEKSVPNEQEYFFKVVQCARNAENAVIYAGSNTILSREALDAVGGFYEKAITEDLATGLKLQSHGYKSYAVKSVHANGLAPTDLVSLFKQRDRWARGCIQTWKQMKVLRNKGLTYRQKLAYFASVLYWYTPIRRLIFILSPILFSVFGVVLLDCSLNAVLLFWLPHYILYNFALSHLSGRIRTPRLSNLYDTILFPQLIGGVILETFGIKKKNFAVTRKEHQEESMGFKLKLAVPHFVLALLSVIGMITCIKGILVEQNFGYLVILFWLMVNLYDLVMAILFLIGRKYYRKTERFYVSAHVSLKSGENTFHVRTDNISEGGMAFFVDFPIYMPDQQEIDLFIEDEAFRYQCAVKGKIVFVEPNEGKWRYSMQFTSMTEEDKLQLYHIVYDRAPTLPQEVSARSGFYTDLKNNVDGRFTKEMNFKRKLPRMYLELLLQTPDGAYVKLVDFNYEYLCIKVRADYCPEEVEIIVDAEKGILFSCVLEKRYENSKKGLYFIKNYGEFVYSKDFSEILSCWLEQFNKKRQEDLDRAMRQKKLDLIEFDELQYLDFGENYGTIQ